MSHYFRSCIRATWRRLFGAAFSYALERLYSTEFSITFSQNSSRIRVIHNFLSKKRPQV